MLTFYGWLGVSTVCSDYRKDKMFVAGGTAGKLLLNKEGWLGQDEIVLHKGQGAVSSIAWRCVYCLLCKDRKHSDPELSVIMLSCL